MLAAYLTRGVKAGLVAGLVLGLFVALVANPLVAYADGTNHAAGGSQAESDHAVGGGHDHGGDTQHGSAVSAAVTEGVSVLTSGLWGVLLGGVVFGIAFYFLEPAIPGTGATKSYLLGVAGFVTVSGAPWLVLPPAPPGASQSLAVTTRLLLYGGMMVAGALACLLSGFVYNRASASAGPIAGAVGALLPFGILAVPAALAPTNTVSGALGPDLRAGLVGLAVFGQALLWLLLAVTHAQLHSAAAAAAEYAEPTPDGTATAD